MSSEIQNYTNLSASKLRFGLVASRFNHYLVEGLLARFEKSVSLNGKPEILVVERVPGAHEIPAALSLLLKSNQFSCMIGLGVVLKGSTSHHHLVAESTGYAIQNLVIKYNIPIINGIVTTDTLDDAKERIFGELDRGREFAHAAIEMGHLHTKWTKI